MRVFVAGGTGAIGKPLIDQLRDAGHEVTVLTRDPAAAGTLIARGIDAITGDALDPASVLKAVVQSRPDVIVNELTNIPRTTNPKHAAREFAATNALRTRGTANLLSAAEQAGVRQVISQSVAFYYAAGPGLATENDPLLEPEISALREILAAIAACETATLCATAFTGTVLRYGGLYGPGTQYADGGQFDKLVKSRSFPIVGSGNGAMSFIHVEDAAQAVVAAISTGAAGIFNIVDDEPVRMNDFVPAYARRHAAPKPPRVPAWLARLLVGSFGVFFMTQLRAASNARAKAELHLTLRYPTWRTAI
jgi:nucleoside-diphosphate-sugar epimerase